MKLKTLEDDGEQFDVSVYESDENSPVVLFAVGSGGLPNRYSSLLKVLVNSGFTVIAPHFERLVSPYPKENELVLRGRRLSLALNAFSQNGAKVAGVGHSIGASTLLAMAGAGMWLGPEIKINIAPESKLSRLVLLSPPTGFFRAPGALDNVTAPILVLVGSEDYITPLEQSKWLAQTITSSPPVDLKVAEGAGHFSFMDQAPPNTIEPLVNKNEFIAQYSREVSKFIAG
jgi:pimeloyl-ACP methyl ester carboxylesterase